MKTKPTKPAVLLLLVQYYVIFNEHIHNYTCMGACGQNASGAIFSAIVIQCL